MRLTLAKTRAGKVASVRSHLLPSLARANLGGNQILSKRGTAATKHNLGMLAEAQGHLAVVRQRRTLLQESLVIFGRLGSPYVQQAEQDLARLQAKAESD